MKNRFFISDTHFGHKNILEYEGTYRPFESIEEHDESLIELWNSVIKPTDLVFHVGDFCLNRKKLVSIGSRLNGEKHLIMGNHDLFRAEEYINAGFKSLHGALRVEDMILTHIPVHPSQLEYRFQVNVHGHLHSRSIGMDGYINVSCEQLGLKPISYEELREKITPSPGN